MVHVLLQARIIALIIILQFRNIRRSDSRASVGGWRQRTARCVGAVSSERHGKEARSHCVGCALLSSLDPPAKPGTQYVFPDLEHARFDVSKSIRYAATARVPDKLADEWMFSKQGVLSWATADKTSERPRCMILLRRSCWCSRRAGGESEVCNASSCRSHGMKEQTPASSG
jgi:hypothetical protein